MNNTCTNFTLRVQVHVYTCTHTKHTQKQRVCVCDYTCIMFFTRLYSASVDNPIIEIFQLVSCQL